MPAVWMMSAPFHDLGRDKALQLFARRRGRLDADLDEPRLHGWIGDGFDELGMQPVENCRRRALGRGEPEPGIGFVIARPPCSAMVGTSGRDLLRALVVTASGLMSPVAR